MPVAFITPQSRFLRESVERAVTFSRPAFTVDGSGHLCEATKPLGLWIDRVDSMIVPRGLVPRLQHALVEAGYGSSVVDTFSPPPPVVFDVDAVRGMKHRDQRLIGAVAEHVCGTIELDTADRCRVYHTLSRALPRARFAVIVPTAALALKQYQVVCREVTGRVGLAVRGTLRSGDRWIVGTRFRIPDHWAGPDTIVLVPYPVSMPIVHAVEWMDAFRTGRRYAFVNPSGRRDPDSTLACEVYGGPVIHRAMSTKVPVQVNFMVADSVPHVSVPQHREAAKHLLRKQQLYWGCCERNTILAQHAVASAQKHRTYVVVEGLPHARTLSKYLPDWPVISGTETYREHSAAIVTAYAIVRRRLWGATLVIASGTRWPPRLRLDSLTHDDDAVRLIDLDDRHHPLAVADAQSRRREYIRRGYTVTVADDTREYPGADATG